LRGGLTLDALVELPHVRAALSEDPVEEVDVALAQKGLERRFAMIVPNYLAVAVVVARSTMLGIVPEELARPIAAQTGLAIHDLPLDLAPWTMNLLWSKDAESDRGLCWLRDRILATFAALAIDEPDAGQRQPIQLPAAGRPRPVAIREVRLARKD
jgi:DNA-binding transcriptional LysR family regulator